MAGGGVDGNVAAVALMLRRTASAWLRVGVVA